MSLAKILGIAFTILIISATLGGLLFFLNRTKIDETEQMHQEALLTLAGFQNHTSILMQKIDVILNAVRIVYTREYSLKETESFIKGVHYHKSILENLYIADSKGKLIFPSDPQGLQKNINFREYFQKHKESSSDIIVISPVEKGLTSQSYRFRISRRFNKPDGSFGGVIIASIVPESFTGFYDIFKAEKKFTVSLVGIEDRRLRARLPEPQSSQDWDIIFERPPSAKATQGEFSFNSPLDGKTKFFYYKQIENWPVIVAVGYSQTDLTRRIYNKQIRMIVMAIILLFLLIVILVIFLTLMDTNKNLYAALKKIERLSLQDQLTGCYNRYFFELQIKNEIARAKNFLQSFSLVMCDIDYFKKINDNYGHLVGDEVLKKFAVILQKHVRQEIDHVIRYGGEEFLILLPQKNCQKAMQLIDALRKEIADTPICVKHGRRINVHLTASFGIASKEYRHLKAITIIPSEKEHFIATADEMLYSAKFAGRNTLFAANLL